jgi:hypothetical protein
MSAVTLKRYRPASLVLFGVGFLCMIAAMLSASHTAFSVAALITFAGLGFFVFTEGFLFPPPERALFSIWLARAFFLVNALAVLSLAYQFLGGLW